MPDALTLIVHHAEDPISRAVTELLHDWSAAGWVTGFALISEAEVTIRGGALAQARAVLPATQDQPQSVELIRELTAGRRARLVTLDPVGPDATWLDRRADLHRAGSQLLESLPSRIGAVEVIVPWHGGHWASDAHPWPGWDTLIAAPQESRSPADGGFDLYVDPEDSAQLRRLAGHAAGFLATSCALWDGVHGSPWDDTDTDDDVRMARTFHTRLDGSAVEEHVRAAALAPLQVRPGDSIAAVGTGEFAARVEGLGELLQLEPRPPRQPEAPLRQVGLWQSIKLLCTFLWRSLAQGPRAISASLLLGTRAPTADRMTRIIFGGNANSEVTVAGTPGRNSLRNRIKERTSSEAELDKLLDEVRAVNPSLTPTSPASAQGAYWRATVNTALALISGEKQGGIEPVSEEGVNRWYPLSAVAPSESLTWSPPDGPAVPGMDTEVAVYDVLACNDALAELAELAERDPHLRDEAAWNRRELTRVSEHWRASFLGQIGAQISGRIGHSQTLLAQRWGALAGLSETPQDEADDLAGKLSRRTRITTAIAVVVGLLLALATSQDWVSWPWWYWLPALLAGWMLVLVIGYLGVQRRIFHLLHRKDQQESEARRIAREIPALVENLRRLLRVNQQYLVWARILPTFLREPLGRADHTAASFTRLAGEVPASVVSGRYVVRDEAAAKRQLASVVREFRPTADEAWMSFVDRSLAALREDLPEFDKLLKEDIYDLEAQRLLQWLEACSVGSPDGLRIEPELALSMGRTNTDRVLRLSGSERILRTVAETFDVVTADGAPLPATNGSDTPAPFRTAAFSLHGLGRDLTRPEPYVWHPTDSTHRVLDEVSSLMVRTERLGFEDLDLKRREHVHPSSADAAAAPNLPTF